MSDVLKSPFFRGGAIMLNFSRLYRRKSTVLSTSLILSILWSGFVFSQEEKSERHGRGESASRPARPESARPAAPPANAAPTMSRSQWQKPTTEPRPQPVGPSNVAPTTNRSQWQKPAVEPRPQPVGPANVAPTTNRSQWQKPTTEPRPQLAPPESVAPSPGRSQLPKSIAEGTTTSGRGRPRPMETSDTGIVAPSATLGSAGSDSLSLQQQLNDLNRRNRGERDRSGVRESGAKSSSNTAAEIAPLSKTLVGSQEGVGRSGTVSERGRGYASPNGLKSSSGRDVISYRSPPPPPPKPVVKQQVVVNIQTGFRGYGTYWTPDWYVRYGHYNYWRPPVVIAPTIWWRAPGWGVTWTWFSGYSPYYYQPAYYTRYVYTPVPPAPIYYNYGDNIVYRGDMVYINGVPYVSADKYYEQGLELAKRGESTTVININQPQTVETTVTTGDDKPLDVPVAELTSAELPLNPKEQSADPSEQWMPLGTFALLTDEETGESDRIIQLAMNRGGILRGNLYDQKADKLRPIQGAIDQETQRVAFQIADEDEKIYECGLWNLTQESLPLLVQEKNGKSETIKAVRLQENETDK